MARMPLPPARPVLYPLRDLSSAITTVTNLPNRRRRLTIDHQPLAGLTPDMLLWWFSHIGGHQTYGGVQLSNYLAWHPIDHIHWALAKPAPGGDATEGARFRIVEAFGGNPDFYVDTTDTVEKLDSTGIRLVRRIAGVMVLQLEHTWSRCDGHTHYVSVLDIGAHARLFRPVNWYLNERVFPEPMVRAWLRHNVEEVGLLEHLLPRLHPDASPHPRATVPATGVVAADQPAR
jgi:hypothetical protein